MRISPREIRQSYAVLKSIARRWLDNGHVEQAMEYIHYCVVLAQQFNWLYADSELEQMEKEIGERLIPQTVSVYTPNPNRVVLFDDFCVTFILAIQYLKALLKAGKEIMLIHTRTTEREANKQFFAYVEQLKGVRVEHIQESDVCKRIQKLHDVIIDFQPSQVLLQLNGDSLVVPVLYRLPKSIKSYLINQADQMFWIGAQVVDYCIEFRPFGATVSLERRGLKREQLLLLPFYPIHDKNPFEGFPQETEGHVVIFSGGDVYKTLDSKRAYWQLIKRILDTHPDVRFLFAAKVNPLGSKFTEQFIKENHFEGRLIEVGFRKDIYECLKHCDIYMGTCPTSGSLMSQLAAINGTPILQYYYPGTPDDETEQALCINDSFQISFRDMDAFMQEADKLITDAVYRKQQGERIRQSMIQQELFDDAVKQIVDSNTTPFLITTCEVNHKLIEDRWYEAERFGVINTLAYVYNLMGAKRCLKYVPTLFLKKQFLTLKNKIHL